MTMILPEDPRRLNHQFGLERRMNWRFARNLPPDVDYTIGPSMHACIMNLLRLLPAFRALLGRRSIASITDAGDGYVAVEIKGHRGKLYYPQSVPTSLSVTLPEQLYSWHWHYYQIPQTQVLPGDVVFDCGSAEGAFAFLNRERDCRIYAFEPLPDFVKALRRTFADAPNVEVVPCALAEKPGQAYLRGTGIATEVTSENTGRPVNIESIDHFCSQRQLSLSYLKADLEGYEMNTLRGAAETILACKPRIAITTYHRKEDPREICAWLKRVNPGYRMLLKGLNRVHGNPVMLHAW
jgi:FkbM family methyltransferase